MATSRVLLVCAVAAFGLWPARYALAAPPATDKVGLPNGTPIAEVDFERHVASLFGRLGCNSAACHGSFQGKGGFRLSLFGQSVDTDYAAIQDGRVDTASPDESLLLVKPSGREKHGGGIRLREDSWEYRLVRQWIAGGARRIAGRGAVQELVVDPAGPQVLAVGQGLRLRVLAHFADGERDDVTAFSEFRSRDEAVLETDANGQITARGPGDAVVIVSYRGAFANAEVLVPYGRAVASDSSPAADNLIDAEVNAHLRRLGVCSSPAAGDEEFLRRATLDATGILPTPDEVRRFVSDSDPDKRSKKIDSLLAHPRRAALWATRMCDITACDVGTMEMPESLRPKRAKMWHDWFRRRFEANAPYDEIVRGVLLATSRDDRSIDAWIDQETALLAAAGDSFDSDYGQRPSLDLFWRRTGPEGPAPVEDLAELVASAFLGLRLHCARCHQHPYDRWTQADFAGYANIFARVQFGSSTELRTAMNQRLESRRQARREGQAGPELPRLQEVFVGASSRPLLDAYSAGPAVPKAPGGPVLEGVADPRTALLKWLTRPDNPFFARSFVNRLWAKYFGAGFVEPVDAFSSANPPRQARLLERLAEEFVQSGFDIRHMERLILSSQAYQRSSIPAGNNVASGHHLARAAVRPLMAEALLDSINAALESSDDFGGDAPRGSQAIELAPNRFSDRSVNEMFRILGRGDRKSLCDCDRVMTPSLRQPIFLMSHPRIVNKIRGGRLARLLDEKRSDAEIIEEFFLATLSRLPEREEADFALSHVSQGQDRLEGLTDIVWALVNAREFITNH
jgi:hypothetical protein